MPEYFADAVYIILWFWDNWFAAQHHSKIDWENAYGVFVICPWKVIFLFFDTLCFSTAGLNLYNEGLPS